MIKYSIIKSNHLLPLGLIVLALGQIINQYISMPDYLHGIVQGMGYGFILLSIIIRKRLSFQ